MPLCPSCSSESIAKNGHIHKAKQRYKCRDWGRQFVEHPTKKVIDSATHELVDFLLVERISLAALIGQCKCFSSGCETT